MIDIIAALCIGMLVFFVAVVVFAFISLRYEKL